MFFENSRFIVESGLIGEDKEPQYIVKNKDTGIIEFSNTALFFVRDWSIQMTQALDKQDWEISNPGKDYDEAHAKRPNAKVLDFPRGGGSDRNN